jgi:hypothetical protein
MDKGHNILQMVIFTKDNILMDYHKVTVNIIGMTKAIIKVILSKV